MLWPFAPLVDSRESIQFRTDVVRPYSSEQRIRLTDVPRRFWSHNYRLSPNELDRAYELIRQNAPDPFDLPDWQEAQRVTVLAADTAALIDTTFSQYQAAGKAVIWQSSSEYSLLTIDAVADGGLTFTTAIGADYTNARIMPVHRAYSPAGMSVTLEPTTYYAASMEWGIYAGVDLGVDPGYATYRSDPLINEACAVGSGNFDGRMVRPADTLDNQLGLPVFDTTTSAAIRSHGVAWVRTTPQGRFHLRELFGYLKGRQKAFWLPTFVPMKLTANRSGGATTMQVQGIGATSGDLFVRKTNGTEFGVRYTSASGTDPQTLTLSGTLPSSVTTADYVCKLIRVRLDADRIEFAYPGNGLTRVQVPVIEVPA